MLILLKDSCRLYCIIRMTYIAYMCATFSAFFLYSSQGCVNLCGTFSAFFLCFPKKMWIDKNAERRDIFMQGEIKIAMEHY